MNSSNPSYNITNESGNRQNIFPVEAQPELIETYSGFAEEAEKTNGRWAMVGIISLLVASITTGQLIPGIF